MFVITALYYDNMRAKWIWLLAMVIVPVSLLVWASKDSRPPTALLQAALKSSRRNKAQVANKHYLTVIDYTKPVLVKRLWVVELATGKTVLSSHVSHALNSGLLYATNFSNVEGSEMSCSGSFVTQATYQGRFGYSLRVQGLDAENSNTGRRSIVFHPSPIPLYSHGCWMTTPATNQALINLIKGGSFVYVTR